MDLLVSHSIELGTKSIEAVNIFSTDEGGKCHMLWTLTLAEASFDILVFADFR